MTKAAGSTVERQIAQLEAQYIKALVDSDISALERLETSSQFDKAIFDKVTFKTYETSGVTIDVENDVAKVSGHMKSERRNKDGIDYVKEGQFTRSWRQTSGQWKVSDFEFRASTPSFASPLKKRPSEIATDRREFVGKPLRVQGRLAPQPNYVFFEEESYFGFFLNDLENYQPIVVYLRRDSPFAKEIRDSSLKSSGLVGEFDIYYSGEAYAATAKRTPSVFAELIGYRPLVAAKPAVPIVEAPQAIRALTPKQIAEKSMPSTVWIVMKGRREVVSGSGFFILSDVVATNFHVIEGMTEGLIKIYGREETYEILGVVGFDKENDLALLKIKGVTGKPLPLNRDDSTAIGDEVYAVGNPRGLEGTFSQGIVSALRKSEGLIQITAPISHGSSGGAVLNNKGEVVGIAVGAKKDGQSLNFAIAVELLRRMTLFSVPKVLPVR